MRKRKIGSLETVELPGDPEKGAIILLHGYGAGPLDLYSLSNLCKGPSWIFPKGPLEIPFSAMYTGNAWFEVNIELLTLAIREKRFGDIAKAFPEELNEARLILDQFLKELHIPISKIVLGGFSQGAVLAVETVMQSNEHFRALLILSGTLINESNWRARVHHQSGTPFFQSHGSHDPLLPLEKAQDLEEILTNGGMKGHLHAFHGGHEIPHSILTQISHFLHLLPN